MKILKVVDPDLMESVHELMLSQGHYVPYLSHLIMSGEEVRGAFSEVLLPCVFVWFNMNYKQGLLIYRFIKYMRDDLGPRLGHKTLVWPISPLVEPFKYAERVGLTHGGQAHWFMSHNQQN